MRDHNNDVEELPSFELTDEELSTVSGGDVSEIVLVKRPDLPSPKLLG